jgi:hypothetical protein
MEFWLVVHQSQKSIVYMLLTLVMHPLLECSFLPWENGHTGVDVTIIAFKTLRSTKLRMLLLGNISHLPIFYFCAAGNRECF